MKGRAFTTFALLLGVVVLAGVASADSELPGVLQHPDAAGITAPLVIASSQVVPVYPPAARAADFEGTVTLAAAVQKDGTVGEIEILESDHPNLGFEQAALEAVGQWRFHPAVLDGEPVDSYTLLRLHFGAPGNAINQRAYVAGGFVPLGARVPSIGGVKTVPTTAPGNSGPGGNQQLAGSLSGPVKPGKTPGPDAIGSERLYDRTKLFPLPDNKTNFPRGR